jgi:hypothetical protein
MFQVQLFAENAVQSLQQAVNQWLSTHKDISVVHSNLNTVVTGGTASYIFYLLYTTAEAQAEALKELAAEVKPEQSVEATDINPGVLDATS